MRKRSKQIITYILTALLGMSMMNYPVHAQETQETQVKQKEENTAVSIENMGVLSELQNMFKTAVHALSATEPNNAGPFLVEGNADGWIYSDVDKTLTFNKGGDYKVTGDGIETGIQIVIVPNITITLTVKDVNCHPNGAGMNIDGTSTVTLMLEGKNEFVTKNDRKAGIEFNNATDGSLTIDGTGSLTAEGGGSGAGIGGSEGCSVNNIEIKGGTIVAKSLLGGAGIGAGKFRRGENKGDNITISGGTIVASSTEGAGIGGGKGAGIMEGGNGSNITISGGTITATSMTGAGIGGGHFGAGDNIIISGGTVVATSASGAGIGGGERCINLENTITISGGTIIATATYDGAGIGSGAKGIQNTITINGGTITATAPRGGAGIGSGKGGTGGNDIKITGGSIKATSDAEAITGIPTNGTSEVYLATLLEQDNINKVIDSTTSSVFNRAGNHPENDTSFYLYLTGEDHILTAGQNKYKAFWNADSSTFTITPIAPTPTNITTTQTAGTITVTEPIDASIYGDVAYKIDNQSWQDSNTFDNLDSSKAYTIYVKYLGNDVFLPSDVAQMPVTTSPATYTITIPQTASAGETAVDICVNEDKNHPFDLGTKGQINVKVLKNENLSNDGMLTLTRQGASNVITSALFVNGRAFTDINNNIATFKSITDNPVSISFAKPTQTNIPAGTYNGTVTFEVTYTQ